jgi:hypothetical protein
MPTAIFTQKLSLTSPSLLIPRISAQLGITLPSSCSTAGNVPGEQLSGVIQQQQQQQQDLDLEDASAVFRALLRVPELLEQLVMAFELGLDEVRGRGLGQVSKQGSTMAF